MTMRPKYLTFDPATEDTDGLANNVTAAAGVALTLAANDAGDSLAHKIIITPSGAIAGDFTITGLDADGQPQSETLASDTANAVTSAKYYSSVTSVLAATLGAETVDIGWVDEFASKTIPLEIYTDSGNASCQVGLTGTANFDIEGTMSDIRASYSPPPGQEDFIWLNDANFANKSASLSADLATNHRAIRLVANSYSAGAELELAIITPR